ncbi:MAG: hypothetical protein ACHRHE_02725 [Tepidisphaerales bacterium]
MNAENSEWINFIELIELDQSRRPEAFEALHALFGLTYEEIGNLIYDIPLMLKEDGRGPAFCIPRIRKSPRFVAALTDYLAKHGVRCKLHHYETASDEGPTHLRLLVKQFYALIRYSDEPE